MKKSTKIIIASIVAIALIAVAIVVYINVFRVTGSDNIYKKGSKTYYFNVDRECYVYEDDDSAESVDTLRVRIYGHVEKGEYENNFFYEKKIDNKHLYCHIEGYDMEGMQFAWVYTVDDVLWVQINGIGRKDADGNWVSDINDIMYYIILDDDMENFDIIVNKNNKNLYLSTKER